MSDPEIQHIANKNGVSAATILISYHINKAVVVLPKVTVPGPDTTDHCTVIAAPAVPGDALPFSVAPAGRVMV